MIENKFTAEDFILAITLGGPIGKVLERIVQAANDKLEIMNCDNPEGLSNVISLDEKRNSLEN